MEEEKKVFKSNKKRKVLLFLIIFVVGNISFYFQERSRWIYEGQPYPKAKEWLVPANMMLVYGTTLINLPFVDERSFVMKPIIGLQDYFVKKWQEHLPNDDAEKYLGWYIFRFRTYIIPNAGSMTLYADDIYSIEETRQINEKAWQTIEAMAKYQAKDREFNRIRYAAFLSVAFFYLQSASIYWAEYNSDTTAKNRFIFDINAMYQDRVRMERFYRLFEYLKPMNEYYKSRFPKVYQRLDKQYYKNNLYYSLTNYILWDMIHQNRKEVCKDSNKYTHLHFKAKEELLKIYDKETESRQKTINKLLNHSVDYELKRFCSEKEPLKIIFNYK